MIVGNSDTFAIESEIAHAHEQLGLRALGFFAIYVMGRSYGDRDPEATMLAIAFDGVENRINRRGTHHCPIAPDTEAEKIATVLSHANDLHSQNAQLVGMSYTHINAEFRSKGCVWAPDGEEGFDDGSHILQFDVGDMVRLIAFQSSSGYVIDPGTIREVWLPQNNFYELLEQWRSRFEDEWMSLTKHSPLLNNR